MITSNNLFRPSSDYWLVCHIWTDMYSIFIQSTEVALWISRYIMSLVLSSCSVIYSNMYQAPSAPCCRCYFISYAWQRTQLYFFAIQEYHIVSLLLILRMYGNSVRKGMAIGGIQVQHKSKNYFKHRTYTILSQIYGLNLSKLWVHTSILRTSQVVPT